MPNSSQIGFSSEPIGFHSSSSTTRAQRKQRRLDITTDSSSQKLKQIDTGLTPSSQQLSQQRFIQIPGSPPPSSQLSTADGDTAQVVIWGTDVSIAATKKKFIQFLKSTKFTLEELEEDEITAQPPSTLEADGMEAISSSYYIQKLTEIYSLDSRYLNVNCFHIREFDDHLYRQMVSYPQEVIPAFDMAANEILQSMYPDASSTQINVRPYNVIKTSNLRNLDPEDLNHLITLSGMVIRCSNIIPEMVEAFFECSVCSNTTRVEVDRGHIIEPSVCPHCSTNFSFHLIHNRSTFIDKQQIKLQETPEDMPAGQTPYTVLLYAIGDLVDTVQPGDRITVTGIYRATPVRVSSRQRTVKSVYRTHIDVVHFRKVDTKRLHDENKDFTFTPHRVDELKALSIKPDIYERLAYSLAPSIYSYSDMKKGVLLQLFGGTKKDNNINSRWRHFRSEINILLCGDPGTSKSQLLKFVHGLVPRGQYTSGKGSSAVGLTAYVLKDHDTHQMVLQTGALVLSDGGICCIDEFDKMSESTRSVLHEVMEQQTLSIAKAGIVCQLNARTSVLAAANPVESQWNKHKTIIENIQLQHTLLSRFDLIYLMLDPQDVEYDRRLARHLVSLYYRSKEDEEEEVERAHSIIPIDVMKDYIAYARNYVHPKLTEEAGKMLIHHYIEMRKIGSGKGHISAYPRQLESLIRLAEAHAKVRLSSLVQAVDVEEAIRLHREAIKQAATDPLTGKIDVSIITTGMSTSHRKKRADLAEAVKKLLSIKKSSTGEHQFSIEPIYSDLRSQSEAFITREMFEDSLKDLENDGFLHLLAGKFIKLLA